MSTDPHTEQPFDLKERIEKVTHSNIYCWLMLLIGAICIFMMFLYHEGQRYSDKFFLVLAVFVIAILINVNQLRKNYLKNKEKDKM
ncbi:hypothetical protein [Arachidicoccus terrestris]|uniref:hypothetical protein n=1 Tax=Arachidicoccus terrestris TaxID=2875539 RepID=UPI001CC5E885|nr:hypothetical protein [Arachidicoccus terrestris]UAY54492.1 hypothetical protein K9M52_13655 [Arachidicoccus terrestris]